MKPTEQELKDLADAINAEPETLIQLAPLGTNNWGKPSRRGFFVFDSLGTTKYRIAPQKKTRPMNQAEWEQYAVNVGRVRQSRYTFPIGVIADTGVTIGKIERGFERITYYFTRLDGTPLTVEDEGATDDE